jgi:hypothetical protein
MGVFMTNYTNYSKRKKLELLYQDQPESVKQSQAFSFFNRILQYLVNSVIEAQEPQVWQSYDRQGNLWWHGYDPMTGRSISRDSETEMRIWLEERYHQSAQQN